jgi:hypothetical protein
MLIAQQRSREEITRDYQKEASKVIKSSRYSSAVDSLAQADYSIETNKLILEVLLDIRDRLADMRDWLPSQY